MSDQQEECDLTPSVPPVLRPQAQSIPVAPRSRPRAFDDADGPWAEEARYERVMAQAMADSQRNIPPAPPSTDGTPQSR